MSLNREQQTKWFYKLTFCSEAIISITSSPSATYNLRFSSQGTPKYVSVSHWLGVAVGHQLHQEDW